MAGAGFEEQEGGTTGKQLGDPALVTEAPPVCCVVQNQGLRLQGEVHVWKQPRELWKRAC